MYIRKSTVKNDDNYTKKEMTKPKLKLILKSSLAARCRVPPLFQPITNGQE